MSLYHINTHVRQNTPPSYDGIPYAAVTPYQTCGTVYPDSSPDSVLSRNTHLTTPERSPMRVVGQAILPRIRCQDQVTEPSGPGPIRGHKKSASISQAYHPYSLQRPVKHRGVSPNSDLLSPASAVSSASLHDPFVSALNSPICMASTHQRRSSLAAITREPSRFSGRPSHTRSTSASSMDEAILSRYSYPYRTRPQYVTATYPTQPASASFPIYGNADLEPFVNAEPDSDRLINYLTAPNPTPMLITRRTRNDIGAKHFWFDVRNLRSWDGFSVQTIMNLPTIPGLLTIPLSVADYFPAPPRTNPTPDSESALVDVWKQSLAFKVNAGLQLCNTPIRMRAVANPATGAINRPDFLSNAPGDAEKTFRGGSAGPHPRARVVGVVKPYEEWNTSMRTGDANDQCKYLRGLAHLHHLLRENGCRYGFLLTEIELLCVRAGGPANNVPADPAAASANAPATGAEDPARWPTYGWLELSAPIKLATAYVPGADPTDAPPMTAALALWFLNLLAADAVLPGHPSWRMEVGGPAACSRNQCVERDAWMPKVVTVWEKRAARKARRWVWPEEPFQRGEARREKR